jgi:hypothetical protein
VFFIVAITSAVAAADGKPDTDIRVVGGSVAVTILVIFSVLGDADGVFTISVAVPKCCSYGCCVWQCCCCCCCFCLC